MRGKSRKMRGREKGGGLTAPNEKEKVEEMGVGKWRQTRKEKERKRERRQLLSILTGMKGKRKQNGKKSNRGREMEDKMNSLGSVFL